MFRATNLAVRSVLPPALYGLQSTLYSLIAVRVVLETTIINYHNVIYFVIYYWVPYVTYCMLWQILHALYVITCVPYAGHNLPDKSRVADTAMQIELA